MNGPWRLIDSPPMPAAYNMAIDEAIFESVRHGGAPPTLRLYSWLKPSVTLGCFQRTKGIDMAFCRENNIDVVRRPTGGRAILHYSELTYCFASGPGAAVFSKGLYDGYEAVGRAFLAAFMSINIEAEISGQRRGRQRPGGPLCFDSVSYAEITVKGKKIIGSAQSRKPDGSMLQQGSIPYSIDRGVQQKAFCADGGFSEDDSTFGGLNDIAPHVTDAKLRGAVKAAFEGTFNVELISSAPTDQEETLARGLLCSKYQAEAWTLRR